MRAPWQGRVGELHPSPDGTTPAVSTNVATGVPTLRDVARATSVSQSTVSRILSDAPTAIPIAAATRERVLETAKRLGYRPNPLARGLMGARTMLLGAVIRDITDPSFPAIIEAVTTEATGHGYNVVLGHAQGKAGEAVELWAILESRHCDAILLLGDLSNQPALIEDLAGHARTGRGALARLTFDRHPDRQREQPRRHHDRDGASRRPGSPAHRLRGQEAAGRHRGACGGLRGLPRAPGLAESARSTCRTPSTSTKAASKRCISLMRLDEPPTAIVGATDVLAIGLVHAALQRGLRVPADVSVTGFDDIPGAHVIMPPLTTMRMPVRAMVKAAIDIAIGSLDRDSTPRWMRTRCSRRSSWSVIPPGRHPRQGAAHDRARPVRGRTSRLLLTPAVSPSGPCRGSPRRRLCGHANTCCHPRGAALPRSRDRRLPGRRAPAALPRREFSLASRSRPSSSRTSASSFGQRRKMVRPSIGTVMEQVQTVVGARVGMTGIATPASGGTGTAS